MNKKSESECYNKVMQIAQELKSNDISVETDLMNRSFKKQMKYASTKMVNLNVVTKQNKEKNDE